MLKALGYLDARLSEASTWSAIAGVLAGMGFNLPPGLLQQCAFWGMLAAGLFGVLLSEAGKKPSAQILLDALAAAGPLLDQLRLKAAPVPATPATPAQPANDASPGLASAVATPVGAILLLLAAGLGLSACAAQEAQINTALQSMPGQLFCGIQTGGGGALVVGLVNAEVAAAAPGAAPIAVIATGATRAFVDQACARAGGIPVSPPANPAAAPQVAVVVPPAPAAAPTSPATSATAPPAATAPPSTT
jgi:hypothetical protein